MVKHSKKIIYHRFFNGIYDSILVKYGAFVFGYVIVGLPVFGPNSEEYLARIGGDTSTIVKDYVRNTGMLINLAKAIGRIVISYKEIQSLAGYTALVTKFDTVLEDMKQGKFERQILNEELVANQGKVTTGQDFIKFDAVPILAPNGESLLRELSFEVKPGMNLMIDGPNGCGKTSIFRILSQLWPTFGGSCTMPDRKDIFFIPQVAYLPHGNLRD